MTDNDRSFIAVVVITIAVTFILTMVSVAIAWWNNFRKGK